MCYTLIMTNQNSCTFPECLKPVRYTGLCRGHYEQRRKGREMSPLRTHVRREPGTLCGYRDCDREAKNSGLCHGHYGQQWRGEEMRPLKIAGPWGEWRVSTKGYVRRRRTNPDTGLREWQHQHRYVMEQYLGRDLLPHEEVHHLNGQRDDNRLENLELWSTSQPKGQRVEDKIEWARGLLEQYGYTVLDVS